MSADASECRRVPARAIASTTSSDDFTSRHLVAGESEAAAPHTSIHDEDLGLPADQLAAITTGPAGRGLALFTEPPRPTSLGPEKRDRARSALTSSAAPEWMAPGLAYNERFARRPVPDTNLDGRSLQPGHVRVRMISHLVAGESERPRGAAHFRPRRGPGLPADQLAAITTGLQVEDLRSQTKPPRRPTSPGGDHSGNSLISHRLSLNPSSPSNSPVGPPE